MRGPLALALALLAAAPPLRASAATDVLSESGAGAADEAAMFGSAADEAAMFAAAPSAATATAGAAGSAAGLVDRVVAADDRLDVGGLLYLRLGYHADRHQPAETEALSSPNYLDLYLDARPGERVRGYARGRLRYDPSWAAPALGAVPSSAADSTTEVELDQLWIKFDGGRRLFVTAGKQPLKFGTGRFWNPTDFLNPQTRDPLAVFDERLGVTLIKLHLPFEAAGGNLYAIADLDRARTPRDVGAALRAEWLLGERTEVSLTGSLRDQRPIMLGADLSTALGDLDLRGEAAVRHLDAGPYYRGRLEFAPLQLPTPHDRRGDWLVAAVGGAEYGIVLGDTDVLSVGAEYFYNQAGYADANLYPWLFLNGGFRPLYNGRHYGAVYGYMDGPGSADNLTLIISTLGNASDRSWLSRVDVRWLALRHLSVDVNATGYYGRSGEFHYGLDVPPLPLVPELAGGLHVPRPLLDVGVGLRVAL